jgi:hypothetical protein
MEPLLKQRIISKENAPILIFSSNLYEFVSTYRSLLNFQYTKYISAFNIPISVRSNIGIRLNMTVPVH